MLHLLWLIPTLPLAGFLVLALGGRRLPRRAVGAVGVGSVGLSALLSLAALSGFAGVASQSFSQTLWTWLRVGDFAPGIAFTLDPLSMVMVLVVTIVGFAIHLYSAESMAREEDYVRFFATMNLFVAFMLVLVLADNLLLLYLGWEGVGLCSYLLIGFWYREPANCRAAIKAFVVTRVGDAALALGLCLIAVHLGTLQMQEVMARAAMRWPPGSSLAIAAAALLLVGALGKSAQLPLHTWLPDAMAGPTPVSALIHAATMVTAGVYLIARMHVLFSLAPVVQAAVAVIGAATLLLAAFSALAQRDIKRVLAYSTMSQVGYMFLALGVGAWWGGIFHLMTHAFFKSLLFLAAGVVIAALGEEHDIFKMGGLRKRLPVAFWTFLIGAASLSALPFVTAGFYSKEQILSTAWSHGEFGHWLWGAGIVGAFLTALYAFRVVFVVFFGEERRAPEGTSGALVVGPLAFLGVLSLIGGVVGVGHAPLLARFLQASFSGGPMAAAPPEAGWGPQFVGAVVPLLGMLAAFALYGRVPVALGERSDGGPRQLAGVLRRFAVGGFGFDWLYEWLFVRPYRWLADINRADFVDLFYQDIAGVALLLNRLLSGAQTGRVRWYVGGIALGAAILIAVVVLQ